MQLDIFEALALFYDVHKTLPATQEGEIMDLFKYFIERDMLWLASKVVNNEVNMDNEQKECENAEMETDSVLHDDVNSDTLSKAEQFYLKFRGNSGKEVYCLFELFKTDGVNIDKINHLIMQKSKDFFFASEEEGHAG